MASLRLIAQLCFLTVAWGYSTNYTFLVTPDGDKLFTLMVYPDQVTQAPTILIRTPYGATECESIGEGFATQGYVTVAQDFRGRFNSSGVFDFWRDAAGDANLTMTWITEQPWSNGVVFTYGGSALGIAQVLQPLAKPPALRAQFPVVDSAQLHKTFFQGGAFREALIAGWMTAEGMADLIPTVLAHEAETDWWDLNDMSDHWGNVESPAVHVSGWYDIFMHENLRVYEGYQYESAPTVTGTSFLVMLPTGHCGGGEITWPNVTFGLELGEALSLDMFNALRNETTPDNVRERLHEAGLDTVPRIVWYVLGPGTRGSTGNFWFAADEWLAYDPVSFYLQPDGALLPAAVKPGSSSYVYDPNNPVPTIGGNNLMLKKCGPWDQSSLEKRHDVITFTTDKTEETFFLNGPITAVLYVSSTANDTDFTAKLTDVFPDGRSMLIQDGIIRMRWRDSTVTPELMVPGQIYQVEISIWNTSYTVNKGHALRLAISSSNAPRFSVNPNNGMPLNSTVLGNITATNTIYYGPQYPSALILPFVAGDKLYPMDFNEFEYFRNRNIGKKTGKESSDALRRFQRLIGRK